MLMTDLLVPSHQTVDLQAIDYSHLPRVASQFDSRIPALPARQARSVVLLWECNRKSHPPVTREGPRMDLRSNFF